MHQTTQPKFRLFNYKKEKKKSFINVEPLLSPVNKKNIQTQKNSKQSLMHSLNFITTNISPLGQHSKNKKNNNSSNCTNSNLHLSKKKLNCKTTSQFLNFKSLKPSNQNGNSSSKKSKNLLLNTLNLSTKNNFNLSLENYDTNSNLEQKIFILQKEKDDLTKTNNSQKKLISKLINENEDNEKKIIELDKKNKKLKDKLSQLKENQNQLILLLKVIGKTGVDIEGIIDKWNEQVECNNISQDDDIEVFTTIKDKEVDESKIDSTVFVPITIDDEDKCSNTKINNHNIPKLNFDKLNKNKFKTLKNNNHNQDKNHFDEITKNENNHYHQLNHSFSEGNRNKSSNIFKLKNFNIFHPKK